MLHYQSRHIHVCMNRASVTCRLWPPWTSASVSKAGDILTRVRFDPFVLVAFILGSFCGARCYSSLIVRVGGV
jgi:hypothetical protein